MISVTIWQTLCCFRVANHSTQLNKKKWWQQSLCAKQRCCCSSKRKATKIIDHDLSLEIHIKNNKRKSCKVFERKNSIGRRTDVGRKDGWVDKRTYGHIHIFLPEAAFVLHSKKLRRLEVGFKFELIIV